MKIYNELESLRFFEWLSETHNLKDTDMKPEYLDELPLNDIHRTVSNSMAFRWFREKYGLFTHIEKGENPKNFYPIIDNVSYKYNPKLWFDFYEEAELECLKKLIEVVKSK